MHATLQLLLLTAQATAASAVTLWPNQSYPSAWPSAIQARLPKYTQAFGVHILADAGYPDAKVSNVAHVLASYLDNDGDGNCDFQALCDKLVANKATMVIHVDDNAEQATFDDQAVNDAVTNLGLNFQNNYAYENNPQCTGAGATGGPGVTTCRDATLEEVLHLIYQHGISQIDSNFALARGSSIANCMDSARGGYFAAPPQSYPSGAWYTYDDSTCDYQCMLTEYQYWALTSKLNMQGSWCPNNAASEWQLCNDTLLAAQDSCVRNLLAGGATFNYTHPTRVNTGNYCTMSGATLSTNQCNALIAKAIGPSHSVPTPAPISSGSWGQSLEPEPSPTPAPAVVVTMIIPGDIAALNSNDTVKEAFKEAFATDIATVLNILASRITVTSIEAGSIVVKYTIAPSADGTQLSDTVVKTALASPITFTTIKASTVIPASITAQYASPVTATVTTGTGTTTNPTKDSSGTAASTSLTLAVTIWAMLMLV
jgi:hypothetical protein